MILIVGAGLAASFAAKKGQGEFNLRLGGLSVGDYVFGDPISVEDETPQSFALAPNSRLFINSVNGDVDQFGPAVAGHREIDQAHPRRERRGGARGRKKYQSANRPQ